MGTARQIIGASPGQLLQLMVTDLKAYGADNGFSATWAVDEPRALNLVLERLRLTTRQGFIVTSVESFGTDSSLAGTIGHVNMMTLATYMIQDMGLGADTDAGNAENLGVLDKLSGVLGRIMTFGFPRYYTGTVQTLFGMRNIDVRGQDSNGRMGVWRISHGVWAALPGTLAICCDPLGDTQRAALVEQGWRFGEIE